MRAALADLPEVLLAGSAALDVLRVRA
jgi:hypothetical protein